MAEPFQADGLVRQLLNDPELLKNAMQMATMLAGSGALDGILSGLDGHNESRGDARPESRGTPWGDARPEARFDAGGGPPPVNGSPAPAANPAPGAIPGAGPGTAFGSAPPHASNDAPGLAGVLPAGVVGSKAWGPAPGSGPGAGPGFARDIARHKRLLEALCQYMEGERKEKLEFVIRLLEILELAGSLRG